MYTAAKDYRAAVAEGKVKEAQEVPEGAGAGSHDGAEGSGNPDEVPF